MLPITQPKTKMADDSLAAALLKRENVWIQSNTDESSSLALPSDHKSMFSRRVVLIAVASALLTVVAASASVAFICSHYHNAKNVDVSPAVANSTEISVNLESSKAAVGQDQTRLLRGMQMEMTNYLRNQSATHRALNPQFYKPNTGFTPLNITRWNRMRQSNTFQKYKTAFQKKPSPVQRKRRGAFDYGQCCDLPDRAMLRQGQFIMSSNGGVADMSQGLVSANSFYSFKIQDDGNLVLYNGVRSVAPSNSFWSTSTHGRSFGNNKLVYQEDRNLVYYDPNGNPIWSSGSHDRGVSGGCLAMQNDRNLVLYDGECRPLWASVTGGPEQKFVSDMGTNDWYVGADFTGGSGGGLSSTGWQHGPVRKMEFWTPFIAGIKGIRVTHWDGKQFSCGNTGGGPNSDITFGENEIITSFEMSASWYNSRVGSIGINTKSNSYRINAGNTLFTSSLPTRYVVGSGILAGFNWRCGDEIDALQPIFVKPVVRGSLAFLSYGNPFDPWKAGRGLSPVGISYFDIGGTTSANNCKSSTPSELSVSIKKEKTYSQTRTTQNTFKAGLNLGLKGGDAKAGGEISGGLSLEYTYTESFSSTTTSVLGIGTNYKVNCPQGRKCSIQALCKSYEVAQPFKATVLLTLDNGAYYGYGGSGQWQGEIASDIFFISNESSC